MEKLPFISNIDLTFIPVSEVKNQIPPKSCPICSTEFGSIGLIKALRKICFYCKNFYCKKCSSRKVTSSKHRVCSTCYESSLKSYFSTQIENSLSFQIDKASSEIELKKLQISQLSQQIQNSKNLLIQEKSVQSNNKSEEKVKILPLLNEVKRKKDLCNKARAKIQPLEQQLENFEKMFAELNHEIYQIEKENQKRVEELQCLKENLATAQDLNEGLLNEFKKKTFQSTHSEQGIEVNSVSDLRKLKKLKIYEVQDLLSRKSALEQELKRLDSEISLFTAHKSCRHSGIFNNYLN